MLFSIHGDDTISFDSKVVKIKSCVEDGSTGALLTRFRVLPMLIDLTCDAQFRDSFLMKLKGLVVEGLTIAFIVRDYVTLVIGMKFCFPVDERLKREILDEAYSSAYAVHPGGTKMYCIVQ